ncbi:MAG: penicillin acylase family protein, partial [Blastocatellia bacterium]
AEIFGKATLEEDKRWRRFGFGGIAEESLQYLAPEIRKALEDYARGVNAYIASLDEKTLPVEFKILQYKPREWKQSDSVVIGKILAEALSSTYDHDLLRESLKSIGAAKFADLTNPITPYDVVLFGKDLNAEQRRHGVVKLFSESAFETSNFPTNELFFSSRLPVSAVENDIAIRERSLRRIGLYAEDLAASNNWVISGKRTADGKPILANDPHLDSSAPGIWYLAHLTSRNLRVAGVTFPGVPGIILGHNENVAWGATNVGPDVQDLYLETFDADNRYKTPDGLSAPTVRQEKIGVRANPLKPDLTYETIEVTSTRNGPIIVEAGAVRYSLKWTAFDPKNDDFTAFYYLNRVLNWPEFTAALSKYAGAMQNFVFADVKGNIGWYAAGKIPVRRKGDGSFPYDGSKSDGDWIGFVPFGELPHLYNPPLGFIVTANQRIAATDYKHPQLIRDFAPPWRARRLYELLNAQTKTTMDSVGEAQRDAFNIPLKMLADEIVSLKAATQENLAAIKAWDGKMTPDSYPALLVNEIRNCTANKIADGNKPVPMYLIRDRILHWAIKEKSTRWLPNAFPDYGSILKTCEAAAPAAFSARYGADKSKWIWGRVSAARFPHPLAAAPLIGGQFATPNTLLSGSGQTPNVASYVSMRHVASPGNWDATRLVIPLGQSGDPKSPHYKDQFESWSTGTPSVFPFSKEAVEKSARSISVFRPN